MREFLNKLISAKEKRAAELRELIKKAGTADEVRSLAAKSAEAAAPAFPPQKEHPVPTNAQTCGEIPITPPKARYPAACKEQIFLGIPKSAPSFFLPAGLFWAV